MATRFSGAASATTSTDQCTCTPSRARTGIPRLAASGFSISRRLRCLISGGAGRVQHTASVFGAMNQAAHTMPHRGLPIRLLLLLRLLLLRLIPPLPVRCYAQYASSGQAWFFCTPLRNVNFFYVIFTHRINCEIERAAVSDTNASKRCLMGETSLCACAASHSSKHRSWFPGISNHKSFSCT